MSRTARSKVSWPPRALALVHRCEMRKTPTGKTPESEWSLRSQNPRCDAMTSGDRELGTAPHGVIREPSDPVKQPVLTNLSKLCGHRGVLVLRACVRGSVGVGSSPNGGACSKPRRAGSVSAVEAKVRDVRSRGPRGPRAEF